MADRVYPTDSPRTSLSSSESSFVTKPSLPSPEKSVSPPGTYVFQLPKDQIYRVPSPENERLYNQYSRRKHRRGCCYRCICFILCLIFLFIFFSGIAAGVIYFVFRPESPNYSIDDIAVTGINITSSAAAATFSPEFDVAVRADNPNNKIGIYYEKDSSVKVSYSEVELSAGSLPAFYQPPNNVTVFQTALRGSGIELSSTVKKSLYEAQKRGTVPLKLEISAPVKLKIGSVKTWRITVKVTCDVTVDKLTAEAKMESRKCEYSIKMW